MKVLRTPTEEWQGKFTCPRCATEFEADQGDVQVDGFKVSGYHFTGTAVCVDKFLVQCPTDRQDILLEDDDLPVLLRDRLRSELAAKRRERGY